MEDKRTAIITGAYGAIGKAIAKQMAKKNYALFLVGKDETKLAGAVEEIIHLTGNRDIRYRVTDISRIGSIREFADDWRGPLHVLVNNACTAPRQRTETEEGIELQFATNVLGYFRMIRFFSPFMAEHDDARIVNVASYWAGGLNLDDLEFNTRRYNNDAAYRQSKQADRMLTVAFASRMKPLAISVNACHPGDVNSKVSNDLGFGGHETPDQGAATPVWLATDPSLKKITGKYFSNKAEATCEFASDHKAIERLFEICEEY